jgi:hypothetical protein
MNVGTVGHPAEQLPLAWVLKQSVGEVHERLMNIMNGHGCADPVEIGGAHLRRRP